VLIGGSFEQVGGGQADTNVCDVLDDEMGYDESFDPSRSPSLWVEPKTRDGVRNRERHRPLDRRFHAGARQYQSAADQLFGE
jgi:hypothetical protein